MEDILKLLLPVVVAILGILKVNMSNKKEMNKLVSKIVDTNSLLVESLSKNGDLLKDLNINFKLVNEQILIDDNNSASIIKSALWNDFGNKWRDSMVNIYGQNHLVEKDNCIKKIQSSTYTLIKNTLDKASTIKGLNNYNPSIEKMLCIVKGENVYERVYKMFVTCKSTGDIEYLKDELYSLYTILYSNLDKEF